MSMNYELSILCVIFFRIFTSSSASCDYHGFLYCLSVHIPPPTNLSRILYSPESPDYSTVLLSSIRNLRFVTPSRQKPYFIVTPTNISHIQASVICGRKHGLPIRVRSGGHDYEGLSYRSEDGRPFIIVDLANIRSVDVDPTKATAWVQAGATLGELYYTIAENSRQLGFPAGICPTVGVGGHLTGGGFGTMLRKYGLAADNILDAILIDANGEVLNKDTMGEDLFWAIRGGGAASFGIVVSWKIKLVPVPPKVTVFTISRNLAQGAVDLVTKWQSIAPKLHENLFIRIVITKEAKEGGEMEVVASFNSLFLGQCEELLQLMEKSFFELRMKREDCKEMSWIQSVLYFAFYTNRIPLEDLLDRGTKPERFFKAKSDFVQEPVPSFLWGRIWGRFLEDEAGVLIMDPYGGTMNNFSDSATPFPHRQGNLYNLQYFVEWRENGTVPYNKHMKWVRKVYKEMSPYVSHNPRAAYMNYRDLDLGKNELDGNVTSYSKAKVWGLRYFKSNFERLAFIKGRVDPGDFFRNEQSIPPLLPQESSAGFSAT
ncbi:berberine bridge enzyme-like 23 [Ananas comosus]|uniref:Berberine bridge enzyme-like 23 n=1 Tax=Ananas comosus TaxID=4615 RepID=A0A199VWL6_ANACO|nr:berberine bridge enzyme-like 23 [Ananas comosus]OAY81632.1 Tetrahydrocannabinolic acid synthase [Ananas comosus]